MRKITNFDTERGVSQCIKKGEEGLQKKKFKTVLNK